MSSLQEMEKSEHDLVHLLFTLPATETALRVKATDTLQKVRKIKAELLRRNPSVLCKVSGPSSRSRPLWRCRRRLPKRPAMRLGDRHGLPASDSCPGGRAAASAGGVDSGAVLTVMTLRCLAPIRKSPL
jgi:hypothetical protein